MRLTAAKLTVLATTFNQPETALKKLVEEGSGLYRGATMLSSLDTETIRLRSVDDVVDGKLKVTKMADKGDLPASAVPLLYVVPSNLGYKPVQGEHGIMFSEKDDEYYPVVVFESKKNITVIGMTGEERWRLEVSSANEGHLLVPVFHVTEKTLITQSAYAHFLAPKGLSVDGVAKLCAALEKLGLTANDLWDFLTVNDGVEDTKLSKVLAKQKKSPQVAKDICVITYFSTGEAVPFRSASQHVDETSETEQPKWYSMGNAELKKFYAATCDSVGVEDDSRETSVARIRQHLDELLLTAEA